MKKLSVVIITFNEEANIKDCLLSVQGIADEIIVVDSFSTDRTQAICETFELRFVQHKFEGYSEQKNYANELCRFDYILSLDADERLSPALTEAIRKEKDANFPADAYLFNRLNFYCGKAIRHGGWYPDRKIRLWKKSIGKWSGNSLHEELILTPGAKTKILDGDLLHYSFRSIAQHITQINKFSDLKARMDYEKGRKSNILKIITLPLLKFISLYLIKGGMRDAYYGLVIAVNSAHFTFLRYTKLRELRRKNKH